MWGRQRAMLLQQDARLPWASLCPQSSVNSRQFQLPSATGAFAFPDLPAVRFGVSTCCSGLPQRPERRHGRPWAPFQNLPRSPPVPASAQPCCAAPERRHRCHPWSLPKRRHSHNAQGKWGAMGTQEKRGWVGTEETSSARGALGFASSGGTDRQHCREHGGKEQQRCLNNHEHEPGKE